MSNLRTILATTSIAAMVALPAAALTIDAATDVQLSALTDAEATAATTAQTDPAAPALSAEAAAFASNAVVSSDDQAIGTVTSVEPGDNGNIKLIIALDSAVGAKAKAFSVQLAPDAKADGTVKLSWSKADLVTTLDSQVQG